MMKKKKTKVKKVKRCPVSDCRGELELDYTECICGHICDYYRCSDCEREYDLNLEEFQPNHRGGNEMPKKWYCLPHRGKNEVGSYIEADCPAC